jgi:hypothetical protein
MLIFNGKCGRRKEKKTLNKDEDDLFSHAKTAITNRATKIQE